MNNIFENACFGKAYKTRDGKKAIFQTTYQNRRVWAMVDKCPQLVPYHLDGTCEGDECFDIISEWQEEINEKELHKLANQDNPYEFYGYYETQDSDKDHTIFNEGFKTGYRKAKEE